MGKAWLTAGICILAAVAGLPGCGDGKNDVQIEMDAGESPPGREPETDETGNRAPGSFEPAGPGDKLAVDLGGGVKMEFVWIPPGEYMRGGEISPQEAERRYGGRASLYESEHPRHRVRLTKGFWLGRTPVTQAQYERITGENPSRFKAADRPVESVSWKDAAEFAERLSRQIEGSFRLPTEAEWEYACRAGTSTAFYFGNDAGRLGGYGWYNRNINDQTHPVGHKEPNNWGLYDMHGNVWEWCADWYGDYPSGTVTDPAGPPAGERRVLRGGSSYDDARLCRSASRYRASPGYRLCFNGFRLVMDMER